MPSLCGHEQLCCGQASLHGWCSDADGFIGHAVYARLIRVLITCVGAIRSDRDEYRQNMSDLKRNTHVQVCVCAASAAVVCIASA